MSSHNRRPGPQLVLRSLPEGERLRRLHQRLAQSSEYTIASSSKRPTATASTYPTFDAATKPVRRCTLGPRDSECSICYEAYDDENPATKVKECGHVFHPHCLGRWVDGEEKSTCPYCKTQMFGVPAGKEGCVRRRREAMIEDVTDLQDGAENSLVLNIPFMAGSMERPIVEDITVPEVAVMDHDTDDTMYIDMSDTAPSSAPSTRPSSPVLNSYSMPRSYPASPFPIPYGGGSNSWSPPPQYNPPSPFLPPLNPFNHLIHYVPPCTFAVLCHSHLGARMRYYTEADFLFAIPPGSEADHMWHRGEITVWVAVPPGWRGTSVVRGGFTYEVVEPETDVMYGVRNPVLRY